jgi:hypothetical protein
LGEGSAGLIVSIEILTDESWRGKPQDTGYRPRQVIYIEPVDFQKQVTDQVNKP